ncbi:MAG: alpha/beta hydrolase [Pseudomonadales bacterium]
MTDTIAGSRTPTSHSYFSQRLRLHYLDWGNSEAPDMLLVHGLQDHCHAWDWFARLFTDDYQVTAPDLRGHGDSAWVRGSSYHQIDYVYDLAQLVKQGALGPTVLVGNSLGGTLAALYAGAYPTEVCGWVIRASSPAAYRTVTSPCRRLALACNKQTHTCRRVRPTT